MRWYRINLPLEDKHEHQHAWTHMPWTWIVQSFGIARWEIEYGGRDAPWKEEAEAGIDSNESHMPWTWIVQSFGIARWKIEYGGRDAPWKEEAEAGIDSNESLGKMHQFL